MVLSFPFKERYFLFFPFFALFFCPPSLPFMLLLQLSHPSPTVYDLLRHNHFFPEKISIFMKIAFMRAEKNMDILKNPCCTCCIFYRIAEKQSRRNECLPRIAPVLLHSGKLRKIIPMGKEKTFDFYSAMFYTEAVYIMGNSRLEAV